MESTNLPQKFVHPYPQPALNGEFGLTDVDIATSADIDLPTMRKKLRRIYNSKRLMDDFRQLNWLIYPNGFYNEQTKRKQTMYVLNVRYAKVFVAQYNNATGRRYMNCLLDYEEIVLKQVPVLKAAVEALTTPIKRKTRTGYTIKVRKPVIKFGLFGPICEVEETKKSYSDLAPHELAHYKIVHRQKVIAGLTKEQSIAISDYDNLFLLPQGSE